jgi:hypothetical protein
VIRSFAVALGVLFRARAAVIAENLFLRRQLALYLERKTRRRRPTPATKFALVILSRFSGPPLIHNHCSRRRLRPELTLVNLDRRPSLLGTNHLAASH